MPSLFESIYRWFTADESEPDRVESRRTSSEVTLWIELSANQPSQGQIYLKDQNNQIQLGPFPTQTHGRLPIGPYHLASIELTGPGTAYPAKTYGPEGIVILESIDLRLAIHGGGRSASPDWSGTLQLQAKAMRSLMICLESLNEPIRCRILTRTAPQPNWDQDYERDYHRRTQYGDRVYPESNTDYSTEYSVDQCQVVPMESMSDAVFETIDADSFQDDPMETILDELDDGYC
jgi:hypothetical protein